MCLPNLFKRKKKDKNLLKNELLINTKCCIYCNKTFKNPDKYYKHIRNCYRQSIYGGFSYLNS